MTPSKKSIARWRRNYRQRVLRNMTDADLREIINYHCRQYQATRLYGGKEALVRLRAARHERGVRDERYRKAAQTRCSRPLAE